MKAQSNNLFWAEQVELNKIEEIVLLYVTPKIGENKSANKATDPTSKAREKHLNNEAIIPDNILNLQDKGVVNSNMNTCVPQDLKISSISYEDHQPAKLNSWDRKAYLYLSLELINS